MSNSKLYHNGHILTMENGPEPAAVLTQGDKITGVGCLRELAERAPVDVEVVDLKGMTLLPAFIDSHSHITSYSRTLGLVSLEKAENFADIIECIRRYKEENRCKKGEWISGFGYDHNFLLEKRHPDKVVLDAYFPDNPIIIAHASGHMGVANAAALKQMGITADTPDPAGGRIGRVGDTREPSGYLEETAFTQSSSKIPTPTLEKMCADLGKAQDRYLQYGIATVQDGLTRQSEWAILSHMAEHGRLRMDTVCYPDMKLSHDILINHSQYVKQYHNRLKIGGYKIFLDGSPQGRTAWMLEPYKGTDDGYKGYPVYADEDVYAFVEECVRKHIQILAHCNGDAAARQFINAYKKALETGGSAIRPVMIHAQLVHPEQLKQMSLLKMIASFFVAHTYYWGDIHLQNFGRDRAMRISPARSALEEGLCFTFHQDTPVLPPDMLTTIWCAVNRLSRNGVKLGEEQCISVYDALKAVTINGAYQYFEEDRKGSIREGKKADLVILDRNPLDCPAADIRSIQVVKTITNGETAYTLS